MSFIFIHLLSREIVVCSASTRPLWGQCSMWLHVSGTCLQLGQSGLVSDHRASSLFVPAIPQTCLHAQTWTIIATVVSALRTISQSSTRSNCWNVSTPAAPNSSLARCLCAYTYCYFQCFCFSCPHADCLEGECLLLGKVVRVQAEEYSRHAKVCHAVQLRLPWEAFKVLFFVLVNGDVQEKAVERHGWAVNHVLG